MSSRYEITSFNNKLIIPMFCTCCLQPTEDFIEISESNRRFEGNKKVDHYVTWKMPLCPECNAHTKQVAKLKKLAYYISVIVGIIVSVLIYFQFESLWSIPAYFLSSILCFYILILVLPSVRPVAPHTSREDSVYISDYHKETNRVVFRFVNETYAKAFAESNGLKIVTVNHRNTMKNDTVFNGIERLGNATLAVVVYNLIVLIIVAIIQFIFFS